MCEPHLGVMPTIDCGDGPYPDVAVQMIGYHSDTGATSVFESPDGIGSLKQADW
jgi:hypothetical protein